MKKLFCYIIAIMVIAVIPIASEEVYAGWELYDDFNSGIIDPTLWYIDDYSGTITPIFGAVRFEHHPGNPRVGTWLSFKQSPETIKAIRVTIMVQSCTGDVRGQISGFRGKVGDDYVMNSIYLSNNENRIGGGLGVLEAGTLNWLYGLYWGIFEYPLNIIGNRFTIATTFFNPQNVIYYVGGLGKHTIELYQPISPTDDYWRGIGTRSESGEGPCVVFFDDVYVLR